MAKKNQVDGKSAATGEKEEEEVSATTAPAAAAPVDPFADTPSTEPAKPAKKASGGQKPSCCRCVCYGEKPFAAMITSVNEDESVNLVVFNDDNNAVQFVKNVKECSGPLAKAWHWPAKV